MAEFLVQSAGWNAVVEAESPGHAVDRAVSASDQSREALGLSMRVIALDDCEAQAIYIDTAGILAKLGYRDVEMPSGLVVPADALGGDAFGGL